MRANVALLLLPELSKSPILGCTLPSDIFKININIYLYIISSRAVILFTVNVLIMLRFHFTCISDTSNLYYPILMPSYNRLQVTKRDEAITRQTRKLSYRKDDREMRPIYGCPLVSPKFPHVPLQGVGGWPLGYEERRSWANCSCN